MKKIFFFLFALILSINIFAQQYPEVSIMDIQYQPDILALGDQSSPLNGDTVTIVGVIMVAPFKDANPDSGWTLNASAPALILQDTSETDWAGMLVRYPNMPTGNPFGILDTGYVIRATGKVVEYFKTTEFDLISFEASNVLGIMQRPQPVKVTLDSLAEIGGRQGKLLAERWESVFIAVDTVTATTGGVGQGSYEVFDNHSTQVIIGNQSFYFRDATPPTPGTVLNVKAGYIQNRDNIPNTTYANLINPAYPGDVEILLFAPNISDVARDPILVGYGDPVTVTSQITDQDGSIVSASLYYRKNMGSNNQLTMTNTTGDEWQAVIPAQNDSSIIDFFIRAVDDDNNISTYPADTVKNRFYYLVLDRPLTIQDVQYNPYGGQFNGYYGYEVTVRGIVTADTSDLEGTETGTLLGTQVFIQNGPGPWSGIKIRGTETLSLNRGDDVTVTGTAGEDFGVTMINGIDSPSNITVNSTGNPVPVPQVLLTSVIDLLGTGTVSAEQWESVLISYEDVTVTDENADGGIGPHVTGNNNYGDILVADASSSDTRIALQYGTHDYHNFWFAGMDLIPNYVRQGDTFGSLTGILWFGFSNYKLLPRKNDDFVDWVTDVEYDNVLPSEYALLQNYPNPFNPSTRIEFNLPVEANVTLKIFNMLGEEVQSLLNNELKSAGRHTVTFSAGNLATGIYIYRLQAGNFSSNMKMILLK
jgi:Secretion system C-terminal sorting domain